MRSLSTPYAWIDLDVMEQNIASMTQALNAQGIRHRPHIKTHKSLEIARMQLAAGASGITCSRVAEAMVMASGGIGDIFLAYTLVGEPVLSRFGELLRLAEVSTVVDSAVTAKGLSALGESLGRRIPVFLEVLSHAKRGGVEGAALTDLARQVSALPGLKLAGICSFTGLWPDVDCAEKARRFARHEAAFMGEARRLLESQGFPVALVSAGSSITCKFPEELAGIDEGRAGTYVFNDMHYTDTGAATLRECALFVRATVISLPGPGLATLDAGSKVLSSDQFGKGFGYIPGLAGAVIYKLNEEHAYVRYDPAQTLSVGDRLDIIPNHACTVANLTDRLFAFRKGEFKREISVDARGKSY